MNVSETVIGGLLNEKSIAADKETLAERLALERAWYADSPLRFQTNGAILRAANFEILEQVVPDQNIKPAMRFLNPKLEIIYPPYLMPYAAATLRDIGKGWRVMADVLGVHSNVRLSVSSLVRSQEYQNELVRKGRLAVPDSTHMCGGTFDLDFSGYRIVDYYLGRDAVVSMRPPEQHKAIADAFANDYGAYDEEPVRLGPEWFDTNVTDALMIVVDAYYRNGWINLVHEGAGTDNSALHIAVAPPYVSK